MPIFNISSREDLKAVLKSEKNLDVDSILNFIWQEAKAYKKLEKAVKADEALIESLDDAKFDAELIQLLAKRFKSISSLETTSKNEWGEDSQNSWLNDSQNDSQDDLEDDFQSNSLLKKWLPSLVLLDTSENANSLLLSTSNWISEELNAIDIRKVSLGLRSLDKEINLMSGIGSIIKKVTLSAAYNLRILGFTPDKNKSLQENQKTLVQAIQSSERNCHQHLIYPATMARLIFATKDFPSDTKKINFLNALKVHAEALLISLGYDPTQQQGSTVEIKITKPDLVNRRQIYPLGLLNILEGVKTVEKCGGMLPLLQRHINLPSDAYNNLDNLFLAEVLNSLSGHFDDPAAYAFVKSLYKKSNRDNTPSLKTLKNPGSLNEYIFSLLQDDERFISKEKGIIKIDCHGLSHSLAETFMKQALESIAADEFDGPLHLIYGWGKHNPAARGKMREVVERVFREMGIEGVIFNKGRAETETLELWRKLAASDVLSSQVALKIVISAMKHNEPFESWEKQYQKSLTADLSQLGIEDLKRYLDGITLGKKALGGRADNNPELIEGINRAWQNASQQYISQLAKETNARLDKINVWLDMIQKFSDSNKPEITKAIINSVAKNFASLTSTELKALKLKSSDIKNLADHFHKYPTETHCQDALTKLAEDVCQRYGNFDILTNTNDINRLTEVRQIFSEQPLSPNSIFLKARDILQQTEEMVIALQQWENTYKDLGKDKRYSEIFFTSPKLSSRLIQATKTNTKLSDEIKASADEARSRISKTDIVLFPIYPLSIQTTGNTPQQSYPSLIVFDSREEVNGTYCYQFLPVGCPEDMILDEQTIADLYNTYLGNKSLKNVSNLSLPTKNNLIATDSVMDLSHAISNGIAANFNAYKIKPLYSADLDSSSDRSFNETDYHIFSNTLIQAIEANDTKVIIDLIKDAKERNKNTNGNLAEHLSKLPQWQSFIGRKIREEKEQSVSDDLTRKLDLVSRNPPVDTYKTSNGGIGNYLVAVKAYVDGTKEIKKKQDGNKAFLMTGQTGEAQKLFNRMLASMPEASKNLFNDYVNQVTEQEPQKKIEEEWSNATKNWTENERIFYSTLKDKCIKLDEAPPSSREGVKKLRESITASLMSDKTLKLLDEFDPPIIATAVQIPITTPIKQKTSPPLGITEQDRKKSFESKEQAFLAYINEPDPNKRFDLVDSLKPHLDMNNETELTALAASISEKDITDSAFNLALKKAQEELKAINHHLHFDYGFLRGLSSQIYDDYRRIVYEIISGIHPLEDVFDGNKWAADYEEFNYPPIHAIKLKSLIQVYQHTNNSDENRPLVDIQKIATEAFSSFSQHYLAEVTQQYLVNITQEIYRHSLFKNDHSQWIQMQWDQDRLLADRYTLILQPIELSAHERSITKVLEEQLSRLRNVTTPTQFSRDYEDKSLWDEQLPSSLSEQEINSLKCIRDFYLRHPDRELAQNLSKMHEEALMGCTEELHQKAWTPEGELDIDNGMLENIGDSAQLQKDGQKKPVTTMFDIINDDIGVSYICGPSETVQAAYILIHQEEKMTPQIKETRQKFLADLGRTINEDHPHEVVFFPINLTALKNSADNNETSEEKWGLIAIDKRDANSPKGFYISFGKENEDLFPAQQLAEGFYNLLNGNKPGMAFGPIATEMIVPRENEDISKSLITSTQSLMYNCNAGEELVPISNQRVQRNAERDNWLSDIEEILEEAGTQNSAALIQNGSLGNNESKQLIALTLITAGAWAEKLIATFKYAPPLSDVYEIRDHLAGKLKESEKINIPVSIGIYSTLAKSKNKDGNPDEAKITKANDFWKNRLSVFLAEKDKKLKSFFETLKKIIDEKIEAWQPKDIDEVITAYEIYHESQFISSKTVSILTNVFPSQSIVFLDTFSQLQKTQSKDERPILLAKMIASKPFIDNSEVIGLMKKLPEEESKISELSRMIKTNEPNGDRFAKSFLDNIDDEALQLLPATKKKYQALLEALQEPFSIKALQKSDDLNDALHESFEMSEETRDLPIDQQSIAHKIKLQTQIEEFGLHPTENNRLLGLRDYMLGHRHEKIIYGQTLEDIRKTVIKQLQKDIALLEKATHRLAPSLDQTIKDVTTPSKEQNEVLKIKGLNLESLPHSGGGWGVIPLQYENRDVVGEHFNTPRNTRVMLVARKRGETYTAHLISEDRLGTPLFERLRDIVDQFKSSTIPLASRDTTQIQLRTLSQSEGLKPHTATSQTEQSGIQNRPRSKSLPG